MRHDNFKTLNLDDVLMRVLTFVRETTGCRAVHWASAQGLQRVHETADDDWQYAFGAVDMAGYHLWSQPASDLFSTFQLWRQVNGFPPALTKDQIGGLK